MQIHPENTYLQELELHVHIACEGHVYEDPADKGRDTLNASDDLSFDTLDTGEETDHSDDSFFNALDTDEYTDFSAALFFFDAEDWDCNSSNTNPLSDPDCPLPTPNASH